MARSLDAARRKKTPSGGNSGRAKGRRFLSFAKELTNKEWSCWLWSAAFFFCSPPPPLRSLSQVLEFTGEELKRLENAESALNEPRPCLSLFLSLLLRVVVFLQYYVLFAYVQGKPKRLSVLVIK